MRMAKQNETPSCLGHIAELYCEYCSTKCTMTALCVFLVMGEYLWGRPMMPPFRDSTEDSSPSGI